MFSPAPLQYGVYYHIFNRGNNRENIFVEERNYRYFLQLYTRHVHTIADTYAYCLLRNHFHFLVRIKDEEGPTGFPNLSGLKSRKPSQHFSNMFNAYAKAFNKANERTGALFQRPFGRVEVTTNSQLLWLVVYIHYNPQKHGFVDDFRSWPHSSFHALASTSPTHLRSDVVLQWFGGLPGFKMAHRQGVVENRVASLTLEN